MQWNKHSDLEGKHAFLSASKHYWLNYDEDRLITSFQNENRKELGTTLHAFAASNIKHSIKMPKSNRDVIKMIKNYMFGLKLSDEFIQTLDYLPGYVIDTLRAYINDGIGFNMTPELVLYYSKYCFGTADTISFRNKVLRIHDFKSGDNPASMDQLLIYATLFCLEYKIKPADIMIELRIYQNGQAQIYSPEANEIVDISQRIVSADNTIKQFKGE